MDAWLERNRSRIKLLLALAATPFLLVLYALALESFIDFAGGKRVIKGLLGLLDPWPGLVLIGAFALVLFRREIANKIDAMTLEEWGVAGLKGRFASSRAEPKPIPEDAPPGVTGSDETAEPRR